jgi:hypothetical protein
MKPSSRLSPGTAERSPSVVTTVQLLIERMGLLLSHGPSPLYQHRLRRLNFDTVAPVVVAPNNVTTGPVDSTGSTVT